MNKREEIDAHKEQMKGLSYQQLKAKAVEITSQIMKHNPSGYMRELKVNRMYDACKELIKDFRNGRQ